MTVNCTLQEFTYKVREVTVIFSEYLFETHDCIADKDKQGYLKDTREGKGKKNPDHDNFSPTHTGTSHNQATRDSLNVSCKATDTIRNGGQ